MRRPVRLVVLLVPTVLAPALLLAGEVSSMYRATPMFGF